MCDKTRPASRDVEVLTSRAIAAYTKALADYEVFLAEQVEAIDKHEAECKAERARYFADCGIVTVDDMEPLKSMRQEWLELRNRHNSMLFSPLTRTEKTRMSDLAETIAQMRTGIQMGGWRPRDRPKRSWRSMIAAERRHYETKRGVAGVLISDRMPVTRTEAAEIYAIETGTWIKKTVIYRAIMDGAERPELHDPYSE